MEIKKELIDELLKDYQRPEDVIGENGLLKQLTKALLERAMSAELTNHLGYEKSDPVGYNSGNSRNGFTSKTLKGDFGEMVIETPRDRNGSFEPQIVKKHQTRFDGFDDKILSMYARGMTTREIQGHLTEMYGVDVSPTLISEVTDGVMEEVKAWQNRPLEPVYGIVYLDALYVKMRHEGRVENRAVYVAIGIGLDGQKDVLGLWSSSNEGAKFWLGVLTELRNRGVKEILIACVDGLKGFPQAIENVFPQAVVQLCIVHLVRASLNYVNWKERKLVAADLSVRRNSNPPRSLARLDPAGELVFRGIDHRDRRLLPIGDVQFSPVAQQNAAFRARSRRNQLRHPGGQFDRGHVPRSAVAHIRPLRAGPERHHVRRLALRLVRADHLPLRRVESTNWSGNSVVTASRPLARSMSIPCGLRKWPSAIDPAFFLCAMSVIDTVFPPAPGCSIRIVPLSVVYNVLPSAASTISCGCAPTATAPISFPSAE
jgi:putative transposase